MSSRNLSFLNIYHNLVKNKMIICTYVDTFWVYWSVKTFWSHILCDLSVWVATERYAPCAITQFCFARYKLKHFNLRRVCKVATEIVQFVYKISQHFFPLTLPVFCKHFYFKYHQKTPWAHLHLIQHIFEERRSSGNGRRISYII